MNITTYQIYCTNNVHGVQESISTCISLIRATERLKEIEAGLLDKQFLTAKPPYFIRKCIFPYNPRVRDFIVF